MDLNDVEYLAQLSKLSLSQKQLKKILVDLRAIIGHMSKVSKMKLSKKIPRTNRLGNEQNVWREDVVETSLNQEVALKNAKRKYNGYFVVKQLVRKTK